MQRQEYTELDFILFIVLLNPLKCPMKLLKSDNHYNELNDRDLHPTFRKNKKKMQYFEE